MNQSIEAMNIVYATDMGYLLPTQVSAASALARAADRSRIKLHILDCGVEDGVWEDFVAKLRKLYGAEFAISRHVVNMEKYAHFKSWHGSRGIYARVDIPSILVDEDWCLYADSDTLFTDDPLKIEEFIAEDLAVIGHLDQHAADQEAWHLEHGLSWKEERFCAGFIVMNLKWFRENGIPERCFELLMKYDFPYNEQDALNLLCAGKIGFLPDEWGRFSWDAFKTSDRGCLHYASDLPIKLMTSKYLDYNDAHKLYFDCARELLGLRFSDVLNPRLRYGTMAKKLFFRFVFKALKKLVDLGLIRRGDIRDYCIRHYR